MRRVSVHGLLAVLAVVAGIHCAGTDAKTTGDGAGDATAVPEAMVVICTPGDLQECPCAGGRSGVRACSDDGTRWGACEGCDTAADSGGEVGQVDVGPDSGVGDSGPDAGHDGGGSDVEGDAGTDAGIDAGCVPACAGRCDGDDGCGGMCPDRCVLPLTCGGGGVPEACGGPARSVAVAAGYKHACAVTAFGGVRCWGLNEDGQLGDGTTENRSAPIDVSGLSSGVKAITAAYNHTCALTAAGGVKCWGSNYEGKLGTGAPELNFLTPVDVYGLEKGVLAISAGQHHTCAVTTSGKARCWGSNFRGLLGDGTSEYSQYIPGEVSGLTSGAVAISAGDYHTCAVTVSGGVKCWGGNDSGQLGDGTNVDRPTPVDVAGLQNDVIAVSAGASHTCALTSGGGVKCWGRNDDGRLGDGTTESRITPVDVTGFGGVADAISAGSYHTCARTRSGGMSCWGNNRLGQLGDGTRENRATPVVVAGLSGDVVAVAAGATHSCAVTSPGGVKCWGSGEIGQLGNGSAWQKTPPVEVRGLSSGVSAIAAGYGYACALTAAGGVKCWGNNGAGQLGDGTETDKITPVDVSGLESGIASIASGASHACALTAAGGVKCWGYNDYGQLGDGTTWHRDAPVDVFGLSSGVGAIAGGSRHTCVVTAAGGVKCWGANWSGQLGDGTVEAKTTPVDLPGLASGIAVVTAGYQHTCALTTSGGVKCWGGNADGQLGDGTTVKSLVPVDVLGLASGVKAITAGEYHTCAVTAPGRVKCWGKNDYGQLGDGSADGKPFPVDVSGLVKDVMSVSSRSYHTCVVILSGGVKCWGNNEMSQLGNGSTGIKTKPVDVSGLARGVSAVAAGDDHSCALTISGGVDCWGNNDNGQLGDGSAWKTTPVDVVGFGP